MRSTWFCVICVLLWVGVVGCKPPEKLLAAMKERGRDVASVQETRLVIPIEAAFLKRGSISAYFETTTRVEAEVSADVSPEGIGKCIAVLADEGDAVVKGQALAELDKREMEASLRQTETQVRQQEVNYLRAKKSWELGLCPKAEYDNAKTAYEQGQASLELQRIQAGNLTVRSPINGVVTKKDVHVGKVVSSGLCTFRVVDPNSFVLHINLPEGELARVREGQAAKVTFDALPGEEFVARVRKLNPNVDPMSGTVKVTLDLDKKIRPRLKDGGFARVRLVLDTRENVLLAPKDTIIEENARKHVFVVKRSTEPPSESDRTNVGVVQAADGEERLVAERVEVETGLEDSNYVEILSGIDDDALVVTLGQHTLKSGSEVKLTNASDELQVKLSMTASDALKAAAAERAKGAKMRMPEDGPGH